MTYRARCARRKELNQWVCVAVGGGGRLATFADAGGLFMKYKTWLRLSRSRRR